MSTLLALVPVLVSAVLGTVYLLVEDAGPARKIGGGAVFLAAVYLQFASPYWLVGVLLQVALALTLELWRRFGGGSAAGL